MAVAVVLLLMGLATLGGALGHNSTTASFAIPANTASVQYYWHIPIRVFEGAAVTGNWTVLSGGAVQVYLMDEATFQVVALNGITSSTKLLASAGGISGTFKGVVTASGTVELLIAHPSTLPGVSGRTTFAVEGTDRAVGALGVVELTAGAIALVLAYFFWERRPARLTPRVRRYEVCPECGITATPAANFCPQCGASLRVRMGRP